MKTQINDHEKILSLLSEHEIQLFNPAIPAYHSYVEDPETWDLRDFDDVISNKEMN